MTHSLRLIIHNFANSLHLLQMLTGVIRMDHFVLHSDIIAAKEFDHLSARVDEVGDVVNDTVDGELGSAETLDGAERRMRRRGIIIVYDIA